MEREAPRIKITREILIGLSPKEIFAYVKTNPELFERPIFCRPEYIPASQMIVDDSLIDDGHVDELAESIENDGQTSAVTVRARLNEEGEIVYDFTDGFHRGGAFRKISLKTGKEYMANASVMYGISDEKLFDLRVLAVNSVRSVSFVRLITWMQKSFEQSKWYQKGLTLTQVMGIAAADSSGARFGLSAKEVIELKNWATGKSKKWQRPVASIYQDLLAVEKASPELVKRVRLGGSPHGRKGEINPTSFRIIVNQFPYRHSFQLRVATAISTSRLNQVEAEQVVNLISRRKENKEALNAILSNPRKYVKHQEVSVRKSTRKHLFTSEKKAPENGGLHRTVDRLRLETKRLRQRLAESQAGLNITGEDDHRPIYESVFESTPLERRILKMFYLEGKDPEIIAFELHLLSNKVWQFLQSGHVKFLQSEREKKFRKQCQSIPKG